MYFDYLYSLHWSNYLLKNISLSLKEENSIYFWLIRFIYTYVILSKVN